MYSRMVLMVICWRHRIPFDANGCVSMLVNVVWKTWMYFCFNEFKVGVNNNIFWQWTAKGVDSTVSPEFAQKERFLQHLGPCRSPGRKLRNAQTSEMPFPTFWERVSEIYDGCNLYIFPYGNFMSFHICKTYKKSHWGNQHKRKLYV